MHRDRENVTHQRFLDVETDASVGSHKEVVSVRSDASGGWAGGSGKMRACEEMALWDWRGSDGQDWSGTGVAARLSRKEFAARAGVKPGTLLFWAWRLDRGRMIAALYQSTAAVPKTNGAFG